MKREPQRKADPRDRLGDCVEVHSFANGTAVLVMGEFFPGKADAFVVDSLVDRAADFGVDCGLGDCDPHEIAAVPHRIEVPENDLLDLVLERIAVR